MQQSHLPANIWVLEPKNLNLSRARQVTSLDMFETNSKNFHDQGLFSVSIFGRVGSDERDSRFGYIDTKLPIFHPFILKMLMSLKKLYGSIISGKAYAIWDEKTKDFIDSDPIAGRTGYEFFMSHWKDINHKRTESNERDVKIAIVEKNKDAALSSIVVVIPAGLRDLTIDNTGRPKEDVVNGFYRSIIAGSNNVPKEVSGNMEAFNNTRLSMQRAFNEVYEHYSNLLNGKGGLIQSRWGSRKVMYSTANVFTSMNTSRVSIADPTAFTMNDTGVGLYQALKGMLPVVVREIRTGWMSRVFSDQEGYASVTDKETLKRVRVNVSSDDYDLWNTSTGIEKTVNHFKEHSIRNRPVEIAGNYVGLFYRNGDFFKFIQDIGELPVGVPKEAVRPITYIDIMYTSIARSHDLNPCLITRYPITGIGSIYPSRARILTTAKSDNLTYQPEANDDLLKGNYAHYPNVVNPEYVDSLQPHPSRLAGLGADFDGDKGSCNFLYTDEAKLEVTNFLASPSAYVDPRGGFYNSPITETAQRVIVAITGEPK